MTKERLLAFADAWGSKDLGKIMAFFAEDCRYSPSVVIGKRMYEGKAEVRMAIARMIALDNSSASRVQNVIVSGVFGFWEWEYTAPGSQSIQGCDFFEFKDDLIGSKKAYRKVEGVGREYKDLTD